MADAAAVELELGAMVSLHAGGVPPRRPGSEQHYAATAHDPKVAAGMGLKPEQLKAAADQREANRGKL